MGDQAAYTAKNGTNADNRLKNVLPNHKNFMEGQWFFICYFSKGDQLDLQYQWVFMYRRKLFVLINRLPGGWSVNNNTNVKKTVKETVKIRFKLVEKIEKFQ
jgi:hypothetical protein